METMETFGGWIKRLRRKKRIGLHRCAGYSGIVGEALRLIETGRTNPAHCKASTIYGLAKTLEIDPAELIERAVSEDEHTVKILNFCREWKARECE